MPRRSEQHRSTPGPIPPALLSALLFVGLVGLAGNYLGTNCFVTPFRLEPLALVLYAVVDFLGAVPDFVSIRIAKPSGG